MQRTSIALRMMLFVCIALLAATQPALGAAAAQEEGVGSGPEILDLHVDRKSLSEICDFLEFTTDQRVIARSIHTTYWADFLRLDRETKRAFDEAGWREFERVSKEAREEFLRNRKPPFEPYDPKSIYPVERLSPLARDAHNAAISGYLQNDQLLHRLFVDLLSICDEAQADEFNRVSQLARRLWFFDRYERTPSGGVTCAFDLFNLVTAATTEEGELAPLVMTPAMERINEVLLTYEREWDQIIELKLKVNRTRRPEDYKAIYEPAWEQQRERASRWRRVWGITHRAAYAIEQIAIEEIGKSAASKWRESFYARVYPDLYRDFWPDRMVDLIREIPGVTESQVEAASSVYAVYRGEFERLRSEIISRALDVKAESASTFMQGDSRKEQAFQESAARLRELINRTIEQVKSHLTPDQRNVVDESVWGAKAAGNRLLQLSL